MLNFDSYLKTKMASGFFALLDDISALMDDVATMTKVATKKTAGILGDDLAVNAEKASGFVSSREIPVLWAITKGSFLNKLIILPIAFVLSATFPPAIIWILLFGGVYLAFEGAEKIVHVFIPHKHEKEHHDIQIELSEEEILAQEKDKIKSAIITDFILSVEIVIIALGTVVEASLTNQILVVTIIAFLATIGVYGIVALIVRMDDLGFKMMKSSKSEKGAKYVVGNLLVKGLPIVVKTLSVVGTIALLLVAGGIFVHYVPFFHHLFESWPSMLKDFVIGFSVGLAAVIIFVGVKFIWKQFKK